MKASDRIVLLIVPFIALIAAYWFLVLAPKRDEAANLGEQITQLEDEVSEQRQVVEFGKQAKAQFPRDYQRFVVLGKAAPEESEAASLLVQLTRIAERTEVEFQALDLQSGSAEQTTTPPPPTSGEPSVQDVPGEEGSTAAAPAAPTEAAAANLPIGATVGPAGFGVMPYQLTFKGGFFKISDFIAQFDKLVDLRKNEISVDGRLLTVDGFSLTQDPDRGFPHLTASFSVTAYLSPSLSSLAHGATPAATTASAESAGTLTGGESP